MTDAAILVTGFPGLRARAITTALLAGDRDARVRLVVHPKRRADAEAALARLVAHERVTLLFGDPAAIDLGLPGATYRSLASEVRTIHHAYQVIDLSAPGDVARDANVGGAREMIELAKVAKNLERLVHYSSVFVSGDRAGLVLEGELAAGQGFRSPVEESLALAEQMLSRHASLPLTVVRAPHVVGDSLRGESDRWDGVYALLSFLAGAPRGSVLPLPPRSESPLHVVPVDFVAKAARVVAAHPRALRKTLHLVDPAATSLRRFIELASKRFGHEVESATSPAAFGRALVKNPGVGLLARRLRVVSELLGTQATYDQAVARDLLAESSVECPPLEAYLDVLLEHVERRLAEPSPESREGAEAFLVAG
ncbi:MAG TPA: SDR family oxidoreductase [Polyangiaceae bacterium]